VLRLEDRGVPNLNRKNSPIGETRISDVRRRMLDDMAVRKFGAKTQQDYIRQAGDVGQVSWPIT
jgi:hypothetical protein